MKDERRTYEAEACDTPPVQVFCRRIERYLPVEEHVRCPYCDGDEQHVRQGDHAAFCDYQPGRDPVCFGFPEDKGRYRR